MKKGTKTQIIISGSAVILITLMATGLFYWPLLFKKSLIENIIHEELPEASIIIDYAIDYSFHFWGKTRVFAKIEITQSAFELGKKQFVVCSEDDVVDFSISQAAFYEREYNGEIDLESAEEILFRLVFQDKLPASPTIQSHLSQNVFLAIGSTSRGARCYLVKETTGMYYLYVISLYQ